MTRRANFKQADLTKALKGAVAAGLELRGCRINPNTGEIEMQFGNDNASAINSFDTLMSGRR